MRNKNGAFINTYVHHRIEDALEGIANAGFRNVELLSTPGLAKGLLPDPELITPKDIEYYLNLCRKFKLFINGIYYYKGGSKLFDPDTAVDRLKKMVDMAVNFGSQFVITDTDEVRTLTIGLGMFVQQESGSDWSLLMAATLFVCAPIIAFFLATQKTFIKNFLTSGIKG